MERAVELAQLDSRQAEFDSKESDAVARLLENLDDVPQASMRVGSLLIVKFQEACGSVVLARTLSQTEIGILERFPEIQAKPRDVMKALDAAVAAVAESAAFDQPDTTVS